MIYDNGLNFLWKQDLSKATSGIIENSGGGDAYHSLFLFASVEEELGADATLKLATADDEAMTDAVTLATINVPKAVGTTSLRLPHGCKKYLKAEISGATTGTISVGLTPDVDLH
jgi:hypothetical protein